MSELVKQTMTMLKNTNVTFLIPIDELKNIKNTILFEKTHVYGVFTYFLIFMGCTSGSLPLPAHSPTKEHVWDNSKELK